MALTNKTWRKHEVTRLFLSGMSQEDISKQLKIAVGTVNSDISEILKSDDTMALQRQIAIISKKNNVSISQIAANLRWANKIKQSCLDDRKIDKFIDGMNLLGSKFSIPPSTLANHLSSIIEMTLRENIEPHKMQELNESKAQELRKIKDEIEVCNKQLEETKTSVEEEQKRLKIKQKDLDHIRQINKQLEIQDHADDFTEYGSLANAFIDMKKMGYNPKNIVSIYKKFSSLTEANETLDSKLQQKESMLRHYVRKSDEEKDRWKDHDNVIEIIKRLVKDGLNEEHIFEVAHVLRNDFPQTEIKQIIEDIRTYGSIAAARLRLKRVYEGEAGLISEILKDFVIINKQP